MPSHPIVSDKQESAGPITHYTDFINERYQHTQLASSIIHHSSAASAVIRDQDVEQGRVDDISPLTFPVFHHITMEWVGHRGLDAVVGGEFWRKGSVEKYINKLGGPAQSCLQADPLFPDQSAASFISITRISILTSVGIFLTCNF